MAMRSTPTMASAQNIVVKNVACINGNRLKETFTHYYTLMRKGGDAMDVGGNYPLD